MIASSAGIPPRDDENEEHQRLHTFEELVKSNRKAHVIWNITNKYDMFDIGNVSETCVCELQKDNRLIPYYLVNITLRSSQDMMRSNYLGKYIKNLGGFEIGSHASELYDNGIKILEDEGIYLSTVESMVFMQVFYKFGENICVSQSSCGCLSLAELDIYALLFFEYKKFLAGLWKFILCISNRIRLWNLDNEGLSEPIAFPIEYVNICANTARLKGWTRP